jgi:hypothetical protein
MAPIISAYIPVKTGSLSTDYVIMEGAFPECCNDSQQYSYKVNSWASSLWGSDYACLGVVKGSQGDTERNCCWDPDSIWYDAGNALRIAMTEYGEFAANNSANTMHAGIAYGHDADSWEATESWASTAVAEGQWVQGWALYVNYTYFISAAKIPRALLAWATYSDGFHAELGRNVYDWDARYNFSDTAINDITPGWLTPSGVQVLYDSARLGVMRATVTIHDGHLGVDFGKVTFTVIFDKCGKVATVFKDVKFLFGKTIIIHDFAFSERYELDLAGTENPGLASYVHYFDWNELAYGDLDDHTPAQNLGESSYYHPQLGTNGYDIVQAYDWQHQYIFAAGYWPNATEFDVFTTLVPSYGQNETTILPFGHRIRDIQATNEPYVPLIEVQWRYNETSYGNLTSFMSSPANQREMRFVEVLTMTDFNPDRPHGAMDWNDTTIVGPRWNQVDTEVAYQIDGQIFRPEDLNTVNHDVWFEGSQVPFPYCTAEDNGPFMYTAVGLNANIVDDAAAAFLSPNFVGYKYSALPILDMNSTLMGSIPFALDEVGGYLKTYTGAGDDTTLYYTVAMKQFAFNYYMGYYNDDLEEYILDQPIKGGLSLPEFDGRYWHFFPAMNPLSERWEWDNDSKTWSYDPFASYNVMYDPNGIATVGGPKANWVTRYFNDYMYAITREGDSTGFKYFSWVDGGTVVGATPTSNPNKLTLDFFPLSTWNSSATTFNYKDGYAVIALGRDESGLRGLAVYGWNARDTYWASEWTAKFVYGESGTEHFPAGTVAIVLKIVYTNGNLEPANFTVVQLLGTITQFGTNRYIDLGYNWDSGQFQGIGIAKSIWYNGGYSGLGFWNATWSSYRDGWWFKKFPTFDITSIQYDP